MASSIPRPVAASLTTPVSVYGEDWSAQDRTGARCSGAGLSDDAGELLPHAGATNTARTINRRRITQPPFELVLHRTRFRPRTLSSFVQEPDRSAPPI